MPWRAATACVAGSSHVKAALPCQDASLVEIHGPILLGAIADGAGSAARSDLGAQAAVKAALTALRSHVWLAETPRAALEERLRDACRKTLEALNAAASEHSAPVADFACTLSLFAASPHWLAALQVGDGQLVVRSAQNAENYELLFKPDRGEYANETTFLTAAELDSSIQFKILDQAPLFICAATDGIERISLRQPEWTPHPAFYKPLEDFIAAAVDPDTAARDIEEFLKREKMNQHTDDDKTLLLAAWNESAGS